MPETGRVLVIQTAFPGDVVLTLPLVQALKKRFTEVDIVVTPKASGLLENHPSCSDVIVFDKRSRDKGVGGLERLSRILRQKAYTMAILPHRSLRSAALALLARIPRRIGFDTSAGRMTFTDCVHYDPSAHEVDRNLALLGPLTAGPIDVEYPWLFPSAEDKKKVTEFLAGANFPISGVFVAVAPGTVWNTKRWPEEHFASLARMLTEAGYGVVLLGGQEDEPLCRRIGSADPAGRGVMSAAGTMSFLQSAELIARARLLISNDSAPVHIASAMRTPVVAIFGATVPAFGFAPYGSGNRIVERLGLECRPCSIHGGASCPIKTFECMIGIPAGEVFEAARSLLGGGAA